MKNLSRLMAVLAASLLPLAGCMPVRLPVDLPIPSASTSAAAAPTVYVQPPAAPRPPREFDGYYVIGTVTDGDGNHKANLVGDLPLRDYLLKSFEKELAASGYAVKEAADIPGDAASAIRFTTLDGSLASTSSFAKMQAKASVTVGVEVVKNGRAVNRLSFEGRGEDTAVWDRNALPGSLFRRAADDAVRQAVAAVVRELESPK